MEIPRDRKDEFRSLLLHGRKWERSDEGYKRLLLSLVESGYSKKRVREVLRKLGLSYNKEKMERIKEEFLREVKEFKQREIESEWFAIFIDAEESVCVQRTPRRREDVGNAYMCSFNPLYPLESKKTEGCKRYTPLQLFIADARS